MLSTDLDTPGIGDSEEDLTPLRCWDCNVNFTERHFLYKHLFHHIKQPWVVLERCQLPSIKITLKSTEGNLFRIVPDRRKFINGGRERKTEQNSSTARLLSGKLAEDASLTEEPLPEGSDNFEGDTYPEEDDALTTSNDEGTGGEGEDFSALSPSFAQDFNDCSNQDSDSGVATDALSTSCDTDILAALGVGIDTFDNSESDTANTAATPTLDSGGESSAEVAEAADASSTNEACITDTELSDGSNTTTNENVTEPTPPPAEQQSPNTTVSYPKIRIKTTGLLKEQSNSLTITEITDDNPNGDPNSGQNSNMWSTPSLEDPLKLPDSDSNIMSLFSNSESRAKDLGFHSSDNEYISLDRLEDRNNRAMTLYNPSVSQQNALQQLTGLPMQALAQQVSRLQPNNSNGALHQQNVLINIQQFPAGPPPPPQPQYQPPPPPMYGHPPPPPPHHYAPQQMHQPYQYQPPNSMYYPPAPHGYPPHPPPHQQQPPPHMGPPPPPQQQQPPGMPQQPLPLPAPPVSQGQGPPVGPQQPQPQTQGQYRPPGQQQQGQGQMMGGPRPQQSGGQPRQQMGGPGGQGGQRMPAPRPMGPRQPMPRQRAPMGVRPRGPGPGGPIRPGSNMGMRPRGAAPPNGIRPQHSPVKRPPGGPNAQQADLAKKKRFDLLTPEKDDEDCQVICMQPKNTDGGLPQIESVQGGTSEAENSIMHLSDSITLSVRNPPPKPAAVAEPKKSDAKAVANILATRGITVTATAKPKEKPPQGNSTEKQLPASLNLNGAVSIIPAATKTNGHAPPKPQAESLPTVDLTDDAPAPQSASPQKNRPGLPYRCDLCPATYPNAIGLSKHRQTYHKTTAGMCELGIPLINLKMPGIMQKLMGIGISNYIPVPSSGPEGTFALPVINARNPGNVTALGATSMLTLGPVRSIRPQHPQQMANGPKPPAAINAQQKV